MRPRSGSGERRPGGARESADLQLLGLLAIADRGCALQDRAQAVLRGCAVDEHPGIGLAREGGYVAGEYHRLHGWAADADHDVDVDPLYRQVALLLMQHCMLVHYAVRLAFPRSGRRLPGRLPIAPELGETARRLRAARDDLARRADLIA